MDTQTILALLARHALTYVGGILAAHGYLGSSTTEGFVSAGMLLAGVAWSWWQKQGQAWAWAELARLKAQKAPTTAAAVQSAMNANKPS
jgi:hypothetical protein